MLPMAFDSEMHGEKFALASKRQTRLFSAGPVVAGELPSHKHALLHLSLLLEGHFLVGKGRAALACQGEGESKSSRPQTWHLAQGSWKSISL